jgi:hypothetical protein
MTDARANTETITLRWTAKGFTDDVTTCDHCGREDLKGTVRMVALSPDGENDGDTYMGVVCAARMTGRKAGDIRIEAKRADRERYEAARAVWMAWSNAHSAWFCARRDAALGAEARPLDIIEWSHADEQRAAEVEWLAATPEPARDWQ